MRLNIQAVSVSWLALAVVGCSQLEIDQKQPDQISSAPIVEDEIQQTFKVSSIADSGPGALREAILLANASPGTDKVIFESEGSLFEQPQTISLDGPLPVIEDNLLIDGYIKNMLWKASGVTLSGNNQYRIFEIADNARVQIESLTIADGHSKYGAGLLNKGDTVVKGVTLINNSAYRHGGAIFNSGMLNIINSTLANNSADGHGGGLYNSAGQAVITNATFAWNRAKRGGALYNQSRIQLANSIVAESKGAKDCVSTKAFDKPDNRNIIGSQSGCGISYTSDDPNFSKLNYYNGPTMTIPVTGSSLAINRGSNSAAVGPGDTSLKWDQRGNGDPRFAAGITDIGAFEVQSRIFLQVDTLEDTDKRWCTKAINDCSFRGALLIASLSPRLSTITFDPALFSDPAHLIMHEALPEVVNPVTVDASDVSTVTVSVLSETDQIAVSNEMITLKNIRFLRKD